MDKKRFQELLAAGQTSRQASKYDWEAVFDSLAKLPVVFKFSDVVKANPQISNTGALRLRLNKWSEGENPRLKKVYDGGAFFALPEKLAK